MKKVLFSAVIVAACSVLSVSAATIPSTLPRHTLLYSSTLESISVGIMASTGKRSIELNDSGSETVLEAESGSLLLGYDFASWLTGFTTLGAGRLKTDGDDAFADSGFKGSLGLSANLWRTDITHPEFMEGTLSFKSVIEYKQLTSSGSRTEYEWSEMTLAVPLFYEMFADYGQSSSELVYSLVLYAGPCFSSVDGSITSGGRDADFSEADNLGITAGTDLYFADNLALGCQFQIFEDTEITAGLFYHF